jgi:hypothetical protein
MAAVLSAASVAQAGDSWIFRPSYYSHYPAHEVEIAPRPSTRLYYTRPAGAYVRWGYWQTHTGPTIRSSHDHYHFYESWIQGGEQF